MEKQKSPATHDMIEIWMIGEISLLAPINLKHFIENLNKGVRVCGLFLYRKQFMPVWSSTYCTLYHGEKK